jgi:hypothetical protein
MAISDQAGELEDADAQAVTWSFAGPDGRRCSACYVDSLRTRITEQDGQLVIELRATGTDGRTEQELGRRLAHALFISAT